MNVKGFRGIPKSNRLWVPTLFSLGRSEGIEYFTFKEYYSVLMTSFNSDKHWVNKRMEVCSSFKST